MKWKLSGFFVRSFKIKSQTRRDFIKTIGTTSLLFTIAPKLVGKTATAAALQRPNLLFIMCDQLTAKVLSLYGGPVSTPNIERIAAEGVRFTNATCVTPYCSPSRMSMVTGMYPHQHGIVQNCGGKQKGMTYDDVTTGKIMNAVGYDTHFYGKWHLEPDKKGDTMPYYPDQYRLFPEYHEEFSEKLENVKQGDPWTYQDWYGITLPVDVPPELRQAAEKLGDRWKDKPHADFATHMGCLKLPLEEQFDVRVAQHTIEAIKTADSENRPFMVTCSFNAPHDPYTIPLPYYEMFDPDELKLPENVNKLEQRFEKDWSRQVVTQLRGPNGEEVGLREYLRIYYGAVRLVDDQVGRILKTLEDLGQLENTIVVFTADHGDMVGGHGMAWKSTTAFYEEVVHIPLMIRYPKLIKHHVNGVPIEHVDYMPTLLEMLGQPIPPHVEGTSKVPYITGRMSSTDTYPYTFSERVEGHPKRLRKIRPETTGHFMVRGNGWKFARYSDGQEYLYNLNEDLQEINNLAGDPKFKLKQDEMRNELLKWLQRTGWKGLIKESL